jgi:hypothetical protein
VNTGRPSSFSGAPLPAVYVDNNIVGAVVKHDHPEQVSAISQLLSAHEQKKICLAGSTHLLTEILRLPEQHRGPHKTLYQQIRQLPASQATWLDDASTGPSLRTDPLYPQLATILPDPVDRLHVLTAMRQGLPFFATLDQRTILSRKAALQSLTTMTFGTPAEIVEILGLATSSGAS